MWNSGINKNELPTFNLNYDDLNIILCSNKNSWRILILLILWRWIFASESLVRFSAGYLHICSGHFGNGPFIYIEYNKKKNDKAEWIGKYVSSYAIACSLNGYTIICLFRYMCKVRCCGNKHFNLISTDSVINRSFVTYWLKIPLSVE